MNLLTDKVIIITGGTSGIGKATAELLADSGAIVLACARNKVDFENERIIFHSLDVTSDASCKLLFDDIVAQYGKIDGLVANAGITRDALTVKMTDDMFDSVINVNLKGIFNIVKYVGPFMEAQNKGVIVNVSSIVGEFGNVGQANYAASKAGIIGMGKSWAKEFTRKGADVRVNTVCPGYVLTDMVKTVPVNLLNQFASQTMLKRLGEPGEIAKVIAFLLSDAASYITGTVIDVNGGMRL